MQEVKQCEVRTEARELAVQDIRARAAIIETVEVLYKV